MDSGAHGLHTFFSAFYYPSMEWDILRDFLDSRHPLALDGQRHATATLACLKIIFIYDQVPHSWRTLRIDQHSQRRGANLKPKTLWHRSVRHWHLRTYLSTQKSHELPQAFWEFRHKIRVQRLRSVHLKFLLDKSPYSDKLVHFTRRRVFRFGYLQRNHPIYMKKAVYALAKYIQRVTGETAEVRACESIWGHARWFTAR